MFAIVREYKNLICLSAQKRLKKIIMYLITSIGVPGFNPNIKNKDVYLVEASFCVQMENIVLKVNIPNDLVIIDKFGKTNFQSLVGSPN